MDKPPQVTKMSYFASGRKRDLKLLTKAKSADEQTITLT